MEVYLPNNKTGTTSKIFIPVRKSRINLLAILKDFDNNEDADYMIITDKVHYYSTQLSMRLSFQHAINRGNYKFRITQQKRIPDTIYILKDKKFKPLVNFFSIDVSD